jgi:hypothetical protein
MIENLQNLQHLVTFVGQMGNRYADVIELSTALFAVHFFESIDLIHEETFNSKEEAEDAASNYAFEGKLWNKYQAI